MKAVDLPQEDAQKVRKSLQNHPDCIPIRFLHDSQSKLKKATEQYVLFGRQLKIDQAMYFIYKQIQQKGLYFYIIHNGTYKMLKPNLLIGKLYDRYSSASKVLYVLYSDRNFAESKALNCIFYFAQIILVIYALLWGYSYFYGKPDLHSTTDNATSSEPDIPVKPSMDEQLQPNMQT